MRNPPRLLLLRITAALFPAVRRCATLSLLLQLVDVPKLEEEGKEDITRIVSRPVCSSCLHPQLIIRLMRKLQQTALQICAEQHTQLRCWNVIYQSVLHSLLALISGV